MNNITTIDISNHITSTSNSIVLGGGIYTSKDASYTKTIITKEYLEKTIDFHNKAIKQAEVAIQALANMKFKVGDAAYHSKLGYVLIKDFCPAGYSNIGSVQYPLGLPSGADGYRIISVDQELWVEAKDLLEITDMTKVLFNKT